MLRYIDPPLLQICCHLSKDSSSSHAVLVLDAASGPSKHETYCFFKGKERREASCLQLQCTVAQPLEASQRLIKLEPLFLSNSSIQVGGMMTNDSCHKREVAPKYCWAEDQNKGCWCIAIVDWSAWHTHTGLLSQDAMLTATVVHQQLVLGC